MDLINTAVTPVKELIAFLYKKAQTRDVHKRQIIRELRHNLIVFDNAFINGVSPDLLIRHLSNDAIREAVKANFHFVKVRPGKIRASHIHDERNRKYLGWTAGRLIDKIDEKVEELKTIQGLGGGSVENVKNNIALMLGNLYFRMKLLADFIRED